MLDDEALAISGFEPRRYSVARLLAFRAACVVTLGVVGLVPAMLTWMWVRVRIERALSTPCEDDAADFVIVTGKDGRAEVCVVEEVAETPLELQLPGEARDRLRAFRAARARAAAASGTGAHLDWGRSGTAPSGACGPPAMVVYRHARYVLDATTRGFAALEVEPGGGDGGTLAAAPLSDDEAARRLRLHGANVIAVPVPPVIVLLLREALHPFAIFQVFAIIVWMTSAYYIFSAFIAVTAAASIAINFWEVRKNLVDTARMARHTCPVVVLRRPSPTSTLAAAAAARAGPPPPRRLVVDSSRLVPGDVFEVPSGVPMPCDAVLACGGAAVNEAMLTGESTVVSKTPWAGAPPGARADDPPEARHTLFCGSMVLQLRAPPPGAAAAAAAGGLSAAGVPLAVVARPGFDSAKGRLVQSILHPAPLSFGFERQALVFVAALFAAALVGFAVNAQAMRDCGFAAGRIAQRGLDIVTIVVPPSLPLALTVGVAYALLALRRTGVFCVSPPRVNVAGKVNVMCFDKTGTLTTDGLALHAVVPVAGGRFRPAAALPSSAGPGPGLPAVLAACHSLTRVAGALVGDPLEVEAFAWTRAALHEPHAVRPPPPPPPQPPLAPAPAGSSAVARGAAADDDDAPVGAFAGDAQAADLAHVSLPPAAPGAGGWACAVVHRFDFNPALQRMSVVVRPPPAVAAEAAAAGPSGARAWPWPPDAAAEPSAAPRPVGPVGLVTLVKGSPEAVLRLSRPQTVPPDAGAVLRGYARRGLRVLAAAWAPYVGTDPRAPGGPPDAALRAAAERDLTFLGFVVLENPLKHETAAVLARLRDEAAMPLHMITGDNALSAVAVARQCGLVPPGTRVLLGDVGDSSAGGGASAPARDGALGGVVWRDVDADDDGGGAAVAGDVGRGAARAVAFDPATLLPLQTSAAAPPTVLALTGAAFGALLAAHRAAPRDSAAARALPRALLHAPVLARMGPEDKAAAVELLAATGLYVGMCGDGANDSLALRAAHVGVALSLAEASVSAPFTSRVPHIGCVPTLLAEGRGALATSFGLFQFMALYSTIQFANALFAISRCSLLSNNMFMYQDMFLVFVLAVTLGATPSAARLTRKRPSGRLLSPYNVAVCGAFIACTFAMQAAVYVRARAAPWYAGVAPAPPTPDDINSAIPETTSVFLLANAQYAAVALLFSNGAPWKRPVCANVPFTAWLAVTTALSLALLLSPGARVGYELLGLQNNLPYAWNVELLAWSAGAVALYAVVLGGLAGARAAGVGTALRAALCRPRPLALHKALRREWAVALAGGAVDGAPKVVVDDAGAGSGGAPAGAAITGVSAPRRPAAGSDRGDAATAAWR